VGALSSLEEKIDELIREVKKIKEKIDLVISINERDEIKITKFGLENEVIKKIHFTGSGGNACLVYLPKRFLKVIGVEFNSNEQPKVRIKLDRIKGRIIITST